MIRLEPRLTVRWLMGYVYDVVSSTWDSGSLIICVKKLKLKDLWPKAIFSHVLIEREREKSAFPVLLYFY